MKGQIITVITTIFLIVSFAHAASQISKEDAAAIEAAELNCLSEIALSVPTR